MKTQRLVAVIAMLALALGLPIADATPSFAATRLSVSPPNPVAREYITIAGRFGTAIQRPVRLQFKTSSGWKSLDNKATTSTGKFVFKTRAVALARTFRVVAPRVTKNGRTYRSLTTASRTVRTVKSRNGFGLVPLQVGRALQDRPASTLASARFYPARTGRKVTLQRRVSGTSAWSNAATSTENAGGSVTFSVPKRSTSGSSYEYRAVAVYRGVPPVPTRLVTADDYDIDFEDEFTTLNEAVWSHRGGTRNPDADRACSQGSEASVWAATSYQASDERVLKFQTKRIPQPPLVSLPDDDWREDVECPYGQFYNGHIGTQGTYQFQYGIVAARMKTQPQQGHHSGVWSQPTDSAAQTTDPATGVEIDAMEYFGDGYRGGAIQHSIYGKNAIKWERVTESRNYLLASGQRWSSQFHVYSVEWTPTEYIFRVDGHETFRTSAGVSKTPQYLILSLLSSGWELPNLPTSGTLTPMEVDWVRVWQ